MAEAVLSFFQTFLPYFFQKNGPKIWPVYRKVLNLHPYSGGHPAYDLSLGYGVIGNTTDSGPVFPGSSPGTPTEFSGATTSSRCSYLFMRAA